MSDLSSDSSRPRVKKTVNKSNLNPSQAQKNAVEPNYDRPPRTHSAIKDPLEGKTLGDNNRYLLQTLLGKGGMSKVYRALDTKFENRIVAIKLMTSYSPAIKQNLIKRFVGEVKAISSLKHHNIIQILDFGVTPNEAPFFGTSFYVMEYFAGKTLQNLLTENRIVPLDSLFKIISQVCAGLKETHEKGIVHRDLKPDNIFLVSGGAFGEIVKIIDFGIAKNISADARNSTQLTQEGSFVGTYRYASPEQCRGLVNIDQRSDIYSLGVILYEAICGNNPYGLDNNLSVSQADWIACHIRVPPKPLKQQPGCENIEDEIENMVMKCLTKSPQDRFSNIKEFQNAFINSFSARIAKSHNSQAATKVVPQPTERILEVAHEEQASSNFPTDSSTLSQDLESSHTPIFLTFQTLHKSRLLIGIGIASVLASMFIGYTYITQRKSYLQKQAALNEIEKLQSDGEYQECQQLAENLTVNHSDLKTRAATLLDECQKQLAEAIKLTEGSDRQIDYTQLSNYLRAGNWKEADIETYEVMLEATQDNFTQESIKSFPCNDLKIVNSLWLKYSNDRFGFGIQNQQYQNSGKSINSLGYKLGWRPEGWMTYEYLWEKFHSDVPPGHLPARVFRRETGAGMWSISTIRGILDRTDSCNL